MAFMGSPHLHAQTQEHSAAPSNNALNSQTTAQSFSVIVEEGQAKGGTQTFRVSKGSEVTLKFLSDTDGVIHLHAYHLELNVIAHQEAQLQFNAKASGKFRVEWHPQANSAHNPLAHEGPPLMSLEVMPI
jgi:hypothetical protein